MKGFVAPPYAEGPPSELRVVADESLENIDPFDIADPCDNIEANDAVLALDGVRPCPCTPFGKPMPRVLPPPTPALPPQFIPFQSSDTLETPGVLTLALNALLGRKIPLAGCRFSPAALGTRRGMSVSGMGTEVERNRTCFPPSGDGGRSIGALAKGRGGMLGAGSSAKARVDVEGKLDDRVGCEGSLSAAGDEPRLCC